MKLLLENWRKFLITEDPVGFVHDLSKLDLDYESVPLGDGSKSIVLKRDAARGIKRAFADNADHEWLATLDTVHWSDVGGLYGLAGATRDELSTTMTLPEEKFQEPAIKHDIGLWVKGRITLAANDHDNIYSGKEGTYKAGGARGSTDAAYLHRKDSSGGRKIPSVSKDYSRYGMLKKGTEFGEKMARENIPYVIDLSTWDPSKNYSGTNEALVGNWRPVGIVLGRPDFVAAVRYYAGKDWAKDAMGAIKHVFRTAENFGVPIYSIDREKLWDPES